ncbi:MAG: hypothetical protein M3Y07_05320 [Acidobacteriota bacterium]|nr:hypothetical protein [Acidobacteriota bacterium]
MLLSKDLKEFIALFHSNGVEYTIVGAYALAFHGRPRFTGDLDVLINPSIENGIRVERALRDFGFASTGLSAADFTVAGQIIQLGRAPNRIDIPTGITGVEFQEVWNARVPGELAGIPVHFISRELFIRNKKATGRLKDRADLEELGEA